MTEKPDLDAMRAELAPLRKAYEEARHAEMAASTKRREASGAYGSAVHKIDTAIREYVECTHETVEDAPGHD